MAKAKRRKQWHFEFAFYLRVRQHLNLFRNESSIAHSRLLPTEQLIKNLEEKLIRDTEQIRPIFDEIV